MSLESAHDRGNESRTEDPPLPPIELRKLVGPTEAEAYDNPSGDLLFPDLGPDKYDFVFDFGCGCGRIARQLIQQETPPRRYVGVDLHRGMVEWCRRHLEPLHPGFSFHHQNVRNIGLNPGGTAATSPFPVDDETVTLFVAWSVFTHVNEAAATYYIEELKRVLHQTGTAITTWFLFDKTNFPMMQEFQNALFINDTDPTNAVIFDKDWLQDSLRAAGLMIAKVIPPEIRGYQWRIHVEHLEPGAEVYEFPEDLAPKGIARPPLTEPHADRLGLDDA